MNLRRTAAVCTALIVLTATAAAYAAIQPYTGSIAFSSKRPGTAVKPVPMGFELSVRTTAPSNTRPPVQLDIKVKIYGLVLNGKDFPTCTLNQIATAHNDTVCPRKAKVASGYIMSTLGSSTNFSAPGAACDPALDVWNSGQGKLTYFFVTNTAHECLGGALKTGSTGPYPGTYKQSGKYFVSDVPVPAYIDYPVAGQVGSLEYEHLDFTTETTKLHGRTISSQAAIGCLKHRRPYSIVTTTTGGSEGSGKHVSTIRGSAAC